MAKKIHDLLIFGTLDLRELEDIGKRRAIGNLYALRLIGGVTLVLLSLLSILAVLTDGRYTYSLRMANLPLYVVSMWLTGILLFSSYIFKDPKYDHLRFFQIYLQALVVYFTTIYLGTYGSESSNAVLFFVVLTAMPMLINDHPYRMNLVTIAVYLLFLHFSHTLKGENFYRNDFINGTFALMISLVICIFVQHLRISDWRNTKALMQKQEHEAFIADMIKFASASSSPDEMIPELLEFIGSKINCDRAYIFEKNPDGTFDNTYEWCRPGVTPQIDNLKNMPYDGLLDEWFESYKRDHNVIIYDMEDYKQISPAMYEVLKAQDINTLVTGPILINGEYVGFYGVDNPPENRLRSISDTITMIEYVICMVIRHKNDAKAIADLSYMDALTGLKNRHALKLFINDIDKNKPTALIMTDLNGLKITNDTLGHDAGDQVILEAVKSLKSAFKKDLIFRMGGDEFLSIIIGEDQKAVEKRIKKLHAICRRNGVSMSIGYNYCDPPCDDFDRQFKEADDMMYADKAKYYKTHKRVT